MQLASWERIFALQTSFRSKTNVKSKRAPSTRGAGNEMPQRLCHCFFRCFYSLAYPLDEAGRGPGCTAEEKKNSKLRQGNASILLPIGDRSTRAYHTLK
jgi:hypothetical protein